MVSAGMSSGNNDMESSAMIMDGGSTTSLRSFLDILQQDASSGKLSLATARPIIIKILAHPNIFCGFDQVKAICANIIDPSITNTLDLFSYGNLKQYTDGGGSSSFMELNDQAVSKLAQLTVMSCIQDASSCGKMSITYKSLAESLGWNDDGPVVDVLIQCVYADVLRGKLCQKTRAFGWDGESLPVVCPRDVPPSCIPDLLSLLRGLETRLDNSVTDLKENETTVLKKLEDDTTYWNHVQHLSKNAQADTAAMDIGLRGGLGGLPGNHQWPNDLRRPGGHRSSKRSRGTTNVVDGFRM